MKTVSFGGKPTSLVGQNADSWVQNRTANREVEARVPTKRLTIDVPVSLHKQIKSQCAMQDLVMADVIRDLLEQRFAKPSGEGPSS